MPCVTPSHPTPIPSAESLGIEATLERTGGDLGPVVAPDGSTSDATLELATLPGPQVHRSSNLELLAAQETDSKHELQRLWARHIGDAPPPVPSRRPPSRSSRK